MKDRLNTQRQNIKNELLTKGKISRNRCLQNYISRLSGHIYAIKEQNPNWKIEARKENTSYGEDYIYILANRTQILKELGA